VIVAVIAEKNRSAALTQRSGASQVSSQAGITATVKNPSAASQQAPSTSEAEKNRKFLENVVVWPEPNDTGWINMYVYGYGRSIGWPFKDLSTFINRAHWVDRTSSLWNVQICMSQQSECTKTDQGKPRAVTKVDNATWLRSIWIDCELARVGSEINLKKKRNLYQNIEEAWSAFVAFRQKVGLPFPSAVVNCGGRLQVYWISETPLTRDEWKPYAHGLSLLLRREGVKCNETTCHSAQLLPVPGAMSAWCLPSRPVELAYLGRRYDFSQTLSLLRNTAIGTRAAARLDANADDPAARSVIKTISHKTTPGAS
jgi:hypothetical protein